MVNMHFFRLKAKLYLTKWRFAFKLAVLLCASFPPIFETVLLLQAGYIDLNAPVRNSGKPALVFPELSQGLEH